MLPLFLADTVPAGFSNWIECFAFIVGIVCAGALIFSSMKKTEIEQPLKIEQTELHSMNIELKSQTLTLNKLDREMGQVRAIVDIVKGQVDGLHARTGSISRDLAATAAKVEGLEKREDRKNA